MVSYAEVRVVVYPDAVAANATAVALRAEWYPSYESDNCVVSVVAVVARSPDSPDATVARSLLCPLKAVAMAAAREAVSAATRADSAALYPLKSRINCVSDWAAARAREELWVRYALVRLDVSVFINAVDADVRVASSAASASVN